MDCVCGGNELKVACQSEFMQNLAELRKDLERRQQQLVKETPENQQTQEVAVPEVKAFEKTNSSAPPLGIGPCLLADAFSCEVCFGDNCAAFMTRPHKKAKKQKADDKGPFEMIKNALTGKATDFKISCTACAAIQPSEKISFALEMFLSLSFKDQHSLFTTASINVEAKTCLGPGSPFRVVFDALGFDAGMKNLGAEYKPFLGDLSVEGRIGGPVAGTVLVARFDTSAHDPPPAVWKYCGTKESVMPQVCDEKLKGSKDSDYRGCQTRTESGRICQRWNSQSPHAHGATRKRYPKMGLESNYCRNPDGSRTIWCYTGDKQKRWEYCRPRECDELLKGSKDSGYRGCQQRTVSGRRCQHWSSQSPHAHKHSGLGLNNCRNPDGSNTIWCYTTYKKKRWEYCKPLGCDTVKYTTCFPCIS